MLTGLIIACEEVAGGTVLRAELPVAGRTVLEQQARLLAEEGAGRIIVIAERLPPGLAAAAGRLRRDGLAIELVREVEDVAQRVQPTERLLMLADGVLTDQAATRLVLAAPPPAILVLPDHADTRGWELIDATARWAGVLLIDGELIRQTARMLGDWDLQSTLLRNAVQAGAERVQLDAAAPAFLLAHIDGAEAATAVEQAISRGATRRFSGLADRFIFDPIARALAPRAMAAMIDPALLRAGTVGLTLIGAIMLVLGWRWPGLGLAMLAGPADTLGRHLAAMGLRARRDDRRWAHLRYAASSAAMLALGYNLTTTSGWGALALAATVLAFMTSLFEHERWIGKPARPPLWLADPDTLAWMLVPFAVTGWWTVGLGAQAALAFASLLKVQRLTARQP